MSSNTSYTICIYAVDYAGNYTLEYPHTVTTPPDNTLDESTSYASTSSVSYYADVDGDGEVDGIIFADLAVDGSGYWSPGTTSSAYISYGTFSWDAVTSGLKEYELTGATYTDTYFGTGEVIAPIDGTSGTDRFYVMDLEDTNHESYPSVCWYNNAIGSVKSSLTSDNIGAGVSNTLAFLDYWSNETYGEQHSRDLWSLSAIGSYVGTSESVWFVPSRQEWAAFRLCFRIRR